MNYYDIYYENVPVGIAYVESVGLYTRFQCRCNFREEGSYRIIAQYGDVQINLGLCVPENNMLTVNARVATKKLNKIQPYFFALDTKQQYLKFIPVDPENEFSYIAELMEAKFYADKETKGLHVKCNNYDAPGITSSK